MRHSKDQGHRAFFFLLLFYFLRVPIAHADQVEIQWEHQEGANEYDLEIETGHKVVFQQRFPSKTTSWSGALPFGSYLYRIRAINQDGVTGPWSEPIPFLATPNTPQPLYPPDKTTVIYKPDVAVTLKWSKVSGISQFLLLLNGASSAEIRKIVTGNEVEIPSLRPDDYTWTVTPILRIRVKTGQQAQSQIVEAKASEPANFRLRVVKDSLNPLSELPIRKISLNFSAGIEAGTSYVFPMFAMKAALEKGFALGLRYAYGRSSVGAASLRYQSLRLNASYYFSEKHFSGIFAQLGAGADFFSAATATAEEGGRLSKAVDLALGWQWKPSSSGLNLAISLGGQYATRPDINIVDVQFSGLLPLATLLLGYAF